MIPHSTRVLSAYIKIVHKQRGPELRAYIFDARNFGESASFITFMNVVCCRLFLQDLKK